jgi:DMSO/TMAO reductase YedYZ molybdopterin-dependent catalytic subunit
VINRLIRPALSEEQKRRVPPGQYVTEKFPVLHYGSVPRVDLATWDFKVWGQVDSPLRFSWQEFKALPRKTVHTDIHCVTRWSKLDTDWEGVPIQTIFQLAGLKPTATHVLAHSEQGYTANLPLDVLNDDDVLLADTYDGKALDPEHGYPLRLFVPKRYFWKSAKWSAASSSSTTTSAVSGSATATTTTRTRGRRSASPSRSSAGGRS